MLSLLQAIVRAKNSFTEQRRSPREQVQFPAWIDTGPHSPRRHCTVVDVSADGARIMMSSSFALPKTFYLVFSEQGTRRRRCKLVWRTSEQMGVHFIAPLESEN